MEMQERYPERLFEAAAPPLLDQARVIAMARGSQQWVRDLNRWANGSVVEMSLSVILSLEELAEALAAPAEPALVVLDAENTEAIAATRALANAKVRIMGVATLPLPREPEGLDALVSFPFSPETIAAQLAAVPRPAEPAGGGAVAHTWTSSAVAPGPGPRGLVTGVLGARGAGSSTVAMAAAQALATRSSVAVVDLGAEASLAMYHDIDPTGPSLVELARAAARGPLAAKQVHGCCLPALSRGYLLLAGAKRLDDVTLLSSAAITEVVRAMAANFDHVVIDLDSATIGSSASASAADAALALCDRVALVADASLHGVHGGLRILERLLDSGLAPERIALCMNRAPRATFTRRPTALKEITDFAAEEVGTRHPGHKPPAIFSLPEQRGVEGAHEEVGRIPAVIGQELASWLDTANDRPPRTAGPEARMPSTRRRRRSAQW